MTAEFTEGQHVFWDGLEGTMTVEVVAVGLSHITYRDSDDVWGRVESTVFSTLAEKTIQWRVATAEEITSFQARFCPSSESLK